MTAGAPATVETDRLARRFGARRALDEVTFSLRAGDCLALFGPNGAGKTTLLRILAGLLRPTSGVARVGGVSLPGGPEARGVVGIISHNGMLYDALTARENVEFAARLYGVRDPGTAAMRALDRLGIAERADSATRALSRGMRQRVSIARAMVHEPRVVLLDEPYTGLDEAGAVALTAALAELRLAGATLVVVTHHLAEGLALATHSAIMRGGRLLRFERTGGEAPSDYAAMYRAAVAS